VNPEITCFMPNLLYGILVERNKNLKIRGRSLTLFGTRRWHETFGFAPATN
jgi:hypothetical protein